MKGCPNPNVSVTCPATPVNQWQTSHPTRWLSSHGGSQQDCDARERRVGTTQEVGGRMIPPGLDIKTFMDDSCPTIAKIPSEWRLVVDVNEDFFHRTNVLPSESRPE